MSDISAAVGPVIAGVVKNTILLADWSAGLAVGSRWFVMRDAHDGGEPFFLQPRWAMSLGRGPMPRVEIQRARAEWEAVVLEDELLLDEEPPLLQSVEAKQWTRVLAPVPFAVAAARKGCLLNGNPASYACGDEVARSVASMTTRPPTAKKRAASAWGLGPSACPGGATEATSAVRLSALPAAATVRPA